MPQWGVNDAASNSVSWGVSNHKTVANTSNKTNFFGNTTVGSFPSGVSEAVGQFGVDATEMGVTPGPAHRGWVERTEGVGQLQSISVTAGGTNYANGDAIEVVAASGANATGNVVTTSNVITSVTISDAGGLFKSGPTINITTGAGTSATLAAVVGGRAGRVTYETLVAAKITGDASDDTQFPDA